jgi:hypothetical protein
VVKSTEYESVARVVCTALAVWAQVRSVENTHYLDIAYGTACAVSPQYLELESRLALPNLRLSSLTASAGNELKRFYIPRLTLHSRRSISEGNQKHPGVIVPVFDPTDPYVSHRRMLAGIGDHKDRKALPLSLLRRLNLRRVPRSAAPGAWIVIEKSVSSQVIRVCAPCVKDPDGDPRLGGCETSRL